MESPGLNQDCDNPIVTLTERAVAQVEALLARAQLEGYGLRVAVTGGGCSGFSYALDFDREEKPGDTVISIGGLKVFIDSQTAGLLKGTVIDYVTGLQATGFKFINPNATGTCGCGTSFSA
jgi:iron-sulfur cluster assembly protein